MRQCIVCIFYFDFRLSRCTWTSFKICDAMINLIISPLISLTFYILLLLKCMESFCIYTTITHAECQKFKFWAVFKTAFNIFDVIIKSLFNFTYPICMYHHNTDSILKGYITSLLWHHKHWTQFKCNVTGRYQSLHLWQKDK